MKIYHLKYETDSEAFKAQPDVDKLEGVLKAEQHPAFGNGPAYLLVITQGDFNPDSFQREYVLAYEDKDVLTDAKPAKSRKPKSEVEVVDIEELSDVEPVED